MLMDVYDAAAGMISFAHFASPDGSIPRSLRQLHETLFYASRMRTNRHGGILDGGNWQHSPAMHLAAGPDRLETRARQLQQCALERGLHAPHSTPTSSTFALSVGMASAQCCEQSLLLSVLARRVVRAFRHPPPPPSMPICAADSCVTMCMLRSNTAQT